VEKEEGSTGAGRATGFPVSSSMARGDPWRGVTRRAAGDDGVKASVMALPRSTRTKVIVPRVSVWSRRSTTNVGSRALFGVLLSWCGWKGATTQGVLGVRSRP